MPRNRRTLKHWRETPKFTFCSVAGAQMGTITLGGTMKDTRLVNALALLIVVLVVAVIVTVQIMRPPTLDEWAERAPLERVTVHPGQVATELIRERVPAGIRAQGDMTYAVSVIGDRQEKSLGSLKAWEEILLPVPYESWTSK